MTSNLTGGWGGERLFTRFLSAKKTERTIFSIDNKSLLRRILLRGLARGTFYGRCRVKKRGTPISDGYVRVIDRHRVCDARGQLG